MPGLFSPSSTSIATPFSGNAGFSEVAGPATSVNVNLGGKYKLKKGSSINVTLTDQGAINAAQELSSRSIKSIELLGSNLTGLFESLASTIRAQGNDVIGAVSEANRGEVENIGLAAIKWGALAVGAYFAARVFMRASG